jgi:asparagine synthase (glutamine-hydrolysing)
MCGIAGIVLTRPGQAQELQQMTERLRHRGPDAIGYFHDPSGRVFFGHTRLCILDLTPSSNQPFCSANGRYVVTFNGEIYNFQNLRKILAEKHGIMFRTTGDTEVIAEGFAVWGTALAEKLEGMFAFAIADLQTGRVSFCRDRVGKKPLYYFRNEAGFYFSSEIKGLLEVTGVRDALRINRRSISSFLHLGFIPEPDTIYQNIRKFPAGHYGVLADNELSLTSYWEIGNTITPAKKSPGVVEELYGILEESVTSRLVSDVPVGTFLSGGTDSSLITAIASKNVSKQLKTYSIGFRESKYDERVYAEGVAKALKTDHTAYELSEKDARDLLEIYLDHFDEPFADTSAIPTMLVSKLARAEVTVALTGDGGDELFQGYGSYVWADRLRSPLWRLSKGPLSIALDLTNNNRLQRISDLLDRVEYGGIRSHIFSQEQYFFSQKEIINELLPAEQPKFIFEYRDPPELADQLTSSELQALFDFNYYLRDDLLVKVDIASMYYGLECRCPLLDHRVIEFATSLDFSYKVRNRRAKWILKEMLRKFLPSALIDRQKWGFSIPLSRWLKGEFKYLINDYLNEKVVAEARLVKPEYVEDLKKDFFSGKDYLYNRLWLLIVLHRWWIKNV